MTPSARPRGPGEAFVCRRCRAAVGDPMYTGPWGHAPQNVCLDCWVNAFEDRPTRWPRQILALWLVANGHTQTEAARAVGASARTIRNWRVQLARNPARFFLLVRQCEGLGPLRPRGAEPADPAAGRTATGRSPR